MRGLCKFESLKDGSIDLNDIATMNELIDIEIENNRRMNDYMENKNGR